MTRRHKISTVSILILALFVIAAVGSHRIAFLTAEKIMMPYTSKGITKYVGSRFGIVDDKGPTWIFIYNSPVAFDASEFTVEVNFIGQLRNVFPPKSELWESVEKRWLIVPLESGQIPATGR